MSTFQKAQRHKVKGRLGIAGPSGSGKTYTALRIASAWAAAAGGRFAVLDTEPVGEDVGSAELYADTFDFDTLLMHPPYHPRRFAEAITQAADQGYVAIVLDTITPAWDGAGGVQEIVEKAGGEFRHWGSAGNPAHQILIDAITNSPIHVIATMRSKMTYTQEQTERPDGSKKTEVKKLGMRPIQRDTIEYELSIFGQVDEKHGLTITKSRNRSLQDKVFPEAGEEFAMILLQWLEQGAPEPLDAAVKRQFKVKPELGALIQGATGLTKVADLVTKYGEKTRDLAALVDELGTNGGGAGEATDTREVRSTKENGEPAPTPTPEEQAAKAAEYQAYLDAGGEPHRESRKVPDVKPGVLAENLLAAKDEGGLLEAADELGIDGLRDAVPTYGDPPMPTPTQTGRRTRSRT